MLIDRQLGNVVVVGSQHSADTLRLREFLSRNGHPFSYIDLDMDDAYRNLLDRFGIAVSEIPIVIGNDGTMVLRNPSTSQLADSLGLNDNIDNSSLHDLIYAFSFHYFCRAIRQCSHQPDVAGPYGGPDRSCAAVRTGAPGGDWRDSVSAGRGGKAVLHPLIRQLGNRSANYQRRTAGHDLTPRTVHR